MPKDKKRSFIIDFGCCLPFGHNLQAVNLYRNREIQNGKEAKSIVCKRVRRFKNIGKEGYDFALPTLYKSLIVDTSEKRFVRLFQKVIQKLHSFRVGKWSWLALRANFSARKIFNKHQFGEDDILILPSADYFGTKAILKVLQRTKVEDRPRLHIRFIGVLEHSNNLFRNSLFEIINLINVQHENITVSAEVSNYANYLNLVLPHIDVFADPYPLEDKTIDRDSTPDGPFTILLPGTNRLDKGYYDIYHLAKEILFEFSDVKLVVQDMKSWDKNFNKKYQKKLASLDNVVLVDAILSRKKIESLYHSAHLILLPYDPATYQFRGSAIHYEAIVNRIPVVVRKGVGFIDEVMEWKSGWAYETKAELFTCIKEVISCEDEAITTKMNEAMLNFKKSSDEAYHSYLS